MIKVVVAGFHTSVQDLGRKGFANIGVPISGAMDLHAVVLANHLLQNDKHDAVIEITFGGCKLEFLSDCFICITGADFSTKINAAPIKMNSVVSITKGNVLSFGKRVFGARTYLAVCGGIQTEKILQSRSFFKGITSQHMLEKGDLLPIKMSKQKNITTSSSIKPNLIHFTSTALECTEGPEYHLLSLSQIQQINDTLFSISSDNSRMGYRLNEIIENNLSPMLTSAVLPGTVQLTPSGKLIVLMRDCQVTGGYPRILQLKDHAINQLSQKTSGDRFKFALNQKIVKK